MLKGGNEKHVANAPHPLYRIDGAWFICMDAWLEPRENDCRVFSFGINEDFSFDKHMNEELGCHVYSFDPEVEAVMFARLRASQPGIDDSPVLKVNEKWRFYRLDITK